MPEDQIPRMSMTEIETEMRTYVAKLSGRIESDGDTTRQALEPTFAAMLDELQNLNISGGAAFFTGEQVEIQCYVRAESMDDANQAASIALRAALHAAEVGTPDWPTKGHAAWTIDVLERKLLILQ
jgi:hypothetical protein